MGLTENTLNRLGMEVRDEQSSMSRSEGAGESRSSKGKGKRRRAVDDAVADNSTTNSSMSLRVRQPSDDTQAGISQACPVCGSFIKPSELEHHCSVELERLREMTQSRFGSSSHKKKRRKESVSAHEETGQPSNQTERSITETSSSIIDKVKRRTHKRHIRDSMLSGSSSQTVTCPVCSQPLHGDTESVNTHVDECLGPQPMMSAIPGGSQSDIESFEEYTWAGQTRVRASTMIEGGLAATCAVSALSTAEIDEDIELDVEGEGYALGKPQYTEADLIPCEADEPKEELERQALRGAVLSMLPTVPTRVTDDESSGSVPVMVSFAAWGPSLPSYAKNSPERLGALLDALKRRIAEQEKQLQAQTVRCLICIEPYHKPVVSIACWHVYCEQCWLQSLGMKKLCPQCNAITSPADLRRIFL